MIEENTDTEVVDDAQGDADWLPDDPGEQEQENADAAQEQAADAPAEQPETPPETESVGMRSVRNALKAQTQRNRQLQEELAAYRAQQTQSVQKPKPRMDDPDIDFDEAKYEQRMVEWLSENQAKEAAQKRQQEELRTETEAKIAHYQEARKTHGKALDEAEELVMAHWDEQRANFALRVAQKPADLVMRLGAEPEMIERLGKISDPVKFAYALGQLESNMKTTPAKPAKPAPETVPSRGAPVQGGAQRLEKLAEQARQTGDYSAYFAAKRK